MKRTVNVLNNPPTLLRESSRERAGEKETEGETRRGRVIQKKECGIMIIKNNREKKGRKNVGSDRYVAVWGRITEPG